jgi:hypothetical protein
MVRKKDFLIFLGAATLLMIVFSTMFLAAKVKRGVQVQTSSASTNFAR